MAGTLEHWIVVSDRRIAKLILIGRDDAGHWRPREHASLVSEWEHFHEPARPSLLGGRSSITHEHLSPGYSEWDGHEQARRFARDLGRWLYHHQQVVMGGRRVTVFAAPQFAGILRQELRGWCDAEVLAVELTQLETSELARHPAVRAALGMAEGRHAAVPLRGGL